MSEQAQGLPQRIQKMDDLAEDNSEAVYDRMPIEDFGKNMLSGLGWKEGEALGKNKNGLVKPIKYVSRQKGLGLGAKALTSAQIKGMKNLGKDVRGKRNQGEAADGQNIVTIGEEVKREKVMDKGSRVYIYKGQHKGLKGIITSIFSPQQSGLVTGEEDESKVELFIELDINHQEVSVKKSKVVLESKRKELIEKGIIGDEEEKSLSASDSESQSDSYRSSSSEKKKRKKSKKSKKSKKKKSKKHKRSRSSSSESEKRRHKKLKRKNKVKWVLPRLVVRVISQKVHGGILYNTKVTVQDALDKDSISILHNNKLFENLREKDLETVMPKIEETVKVVRGKNRGLTGQLLVRDKKANKVKVMLNRSLDVVEISQDDCCKFA